MTGPADHLAARSPEPTTRTRWYSAPWWVGVSGIFTIVGVIVAVIAIVATRPDDGATATGTDTTSPHQSTTTSTPTSEPADAGPTAPATKPAYAEPATEELKLVAESGGLSSWLDVDGPRVFITQSYSDEVSEKTQADLQYTTDGEFSTLFTNGFAQVGYVPAGTVTLDQCLAKVALQPLGQHEEPEIDRNICVVSTQGTVAWIRVVQFTEPRVYDHPSLLVRATIWKHAS